MNKTSINALSARHTRRRFRLVVALVASSLILSACGFHLRGQTPLSPRLAPLALDGDDRDLLAELRAAVKFNGIAMASDVESAGAVLRLKDTRYLRRVRTTDAQGRATGYTLHYLVLVDVVDADGEALIEEFRVSTRRDLAFNRNQVLQAERRERTLREEMQEQLSQTIMRRLSRLSAAVTKHARYYAATRDRSAGGKT